MKYIKNTGYFFAIVSITLIFCTTGFSGTYVYPPKEASKSPQGSHAPKPSPVSKPQEKASDPPALPKPESNTGQSSAGKPYQHTEKKGKKGPIKSSGFTR